MVNMVMTDGRRRIVLRMRKILESCRTEMKWLVTI